MLQYRDLERARTERVQMLLQSDLQPIIVRPEVEQNSETIVKTGADVGIPDHQLLNWTTVAGSTSISTPSCFPTIRRCRPAHGADLPWWPARPGWCSRTSPTSRRRHQSTARVVWASLGTPAPTETAFDWPANTNVGSAPSSCRASRSI
jgi:hypothetical protein